MGKGGVGNTIHMMRPAHLGRMSLPSAVNCLDLSQAEVPEGPGLP